MRRPSPYELPSYAVEANNQHYGISHRFNSFDQAWKSVRIIGTWGLFRGHKFLLLEQKSPNNFDILDHKVLGHS